MSKTPNDDDMVIRVARAIYKGYAEADDDGAEPPWDKLPDDDRAVFELMAIEAVREFAKPSLLMLAAGTNVLQEDFEINTAEAHELLEMLLGDMTLAALQEPIEPTVSGNDTEN